MSALKRIATFTSAAGGTLVVVEGARYATLEKSEYHTLQSSLYQFACYDALRVMGAMARGGHDSDCNAFEARQRELLQQQLKANEATAYGRDYGFTGLLAEADFVNAFRRSHPTTRYEHFAPYVDRVANGEVSVLNAEPETLLAATSGTSGKRALLPSTPTMSSTFFGRGILVVFDTMRRADVNCFELQKTCKLTFAASWQTSPGGLRVGPNSSGPKDKGFEKLLPLYSTPMAGYQIEGDEAAALYVHALFAARDSKLGILEANFVSLPFRLLNLVANEGAQLAADLEQGCLHAAIADRLPEATVKAINEALGGANPKRAAQLRVALSNPSENGGGGDAAADPLVGLAKRIWPNLRLILANATGAFEVYAQRLQAGICQGTPILSTILAASEGLMGIALTPSIDGKSSFCLVPRAMFFEFMPLATSGDKTRKEGELVGGTLLGHQLAVGDDYELVITNLGGLYRYRLGDVVRVTGFHGKAPLVEFRYRQGQLLNLRGEKLPEPALAAAVAAALPRNVGEYTAMEVIDASPPHYRVFVEAEKGLGGQLDGCHDGTAAARLDAALKKENPVYATWRQKGAIGAPEVQEVQSGAFELLRAQRLADGVAAQQLKVSRVLRTEKQIALLTGNTIGSAGATSKHSSNWLGRFFSK